MATNVAEYGYPKDNGDDPNDQFFAGLDERDEEDQFMSSAIFAVNSDVYFLYMIGKMCAETGHNLHQGLQALNDYYLFMWHHGSSHGTSEQLNNMSNRNPLNQNFASNQQAQRIT